MKASFAALALVFYAFAAAAEIPEELDAQMRVAKTENLSSSVRTLADCPATPIQLPATITGTLTFASCLDVLNLRGDIYAITVSAGETIDIDYYSSDFETFLYMYLGNGTSINTNFISSLPLSGIGVSRRTAHHTFAAAGTYRLEARALWSATSTLRNTGSYTLKVTTSKVTSSCSTSTTVCLLNDRFRVSIAYVNPFSTPPNQPGTFQAARLLQGAQNPDVALFGFSSAQAVEVVVRIQDARPFAPRFDVYYGGMTDVGYTVTVTDTVKGIVRQYSNPVGKVGGGVDRTSFPAP